MPGANAIECGNVRTVCGDEERREPSLCLGATAGLVVVAERFFEPSRSATIGSRANSFCRSRSVSRWEALSSRCLA
jgi:hypothetical protein